MQISSLQYNLDENIDKYVGRASYVPPANKLYADDLKTKSIDFLKL